MIQIGERLKLARGVETASSRDNFNAEYTCQARTNLFESISRRVSIVSEGMPTFIGEQIYYATANRHLDIEFAVLSSPPYQVMLLSNQHEPNLVFKTYFLGFKFGPICTKLNDNGPLEIILPVRNKEKFRLEASDFDNLKMSSRFKLTIDKASNADVGLYNCTVTNKFGLSVYSFEIRKRRMLNFVNFVNLVDVKF